MSGIRTFKDLIAWQKAIALARTIYQETQSFPNTERFGLTNQIRRAAVSISTNVVEGHGRHSTPDFVRFLRIAKGSTDEVESLWILARELGFVPYGRFDTLEVLILEQTRVLDALIRSIPQPARQYKR